MSSKVPFPPPGFDELSPEEQADYVEALWERITPPSEPIDVPDWHREIIEERMARYAETGFKGRPWEEVNAEILAELTKSQEKTES